MLLNTVIWEYAQSNLNLNQDQVIIENNFTFVVTHLNTFQMTRKTIGHLNNSTCWPYITLKSDGV